MLDILFPFAGGLGLFLTGMMLLSSGLVSFAGGALQRALVRFTSTPLRAFASGTVITAAMQSSTATTLTLIGFVSAGLIPFSQAIGVVIGASLGNTAVGWVVATAGLKINLGFYTLPLVGLGALLRLFARGRPADLGQALTGFGLLFLGLGTLQEGMRVLAETFHLAALPSEGFSARLLIMLIGLAMTTALQSSAAAVATTLTALHTETINFDQAAALVVGAAIGTAVAGALVTLAGTVYARRTAVAHILFNLAAGLIAIALLPLYSTTAHWIASHSGLAPGPTTLAAFHTLFIAVGVVLILPFTGTLARIVEWLLPERGDVYTQHLDTTLLTVPEVALEASQRSLEKIALALLGLYERYLTTPSGEVPSQNLLALQRALDQTFSFISRIPLPSEDDSLVDRRIAQLQATDHLHRFRGHLQDGVQTRLQFNDAMYQPTLNQLRSLFAQARTHLEADGDIADPGASELAFAKASSRARQHLLLEAGRSRKSPAMVLRNVEHFRWLERAAHLLGRLSHHLLLSRSVQAGEPSPDREEEQPRKRPEEPLAEAAS